MILTNFIETFGTWIGLCALFVSVVVWTAAALGCLWGVLVALRFAWETVQEVREWLRTR